MPDLTQLLYYLYHENWVVIQWRTTSWYFWTGFRLLWMFDGILLANISLSHQWHIHWHSCDKCIGHMIFSIHWCSLLLFVWHESIHCHVPSHKVTEFTLKQRFSLQYTICGHEKTISVFEGSYTIGCWDQIFWNKYSSILGTSFTVVYSANSGVNFSSKLIFASVNFCFFTLFSRCLTQSDISSSLGT